MEILFISLLPLLLGFWASEKIRAGNKKWEDMINVELLFFIFSVLLVGTEPYLINYACTLSTFTSLGGILLIFYPKSDKKNDPVPLIFSILILVAATLSVWVRYSLIFF